MVREILDLETNPDFRSASISGYECKLWGQYPALVDGIVYRVQTVEGAKRLAAYETSNYCPQDCCIRRTGGQDPGQEDGYVFKYVGDRKDMSEGVFDLGIWLR